MARYNVGGFNAEAIVRAGSYDASAAFELQSVLCSGHVVYYAGATDAISAPGLSAFLGNAGVDAATLFTPVAGDQPQGDDGKELLIVDLSGHAHTITTAANAIVNSKHILTWNGTVGSYITLVAMNGVWVPVSSSGVTVS